MLHEMRRKDRQLDNAEAEKLLTTGEYGILSTTGEDGCPYGVPVSFAYADGIIYFHCAKDVGLKVENMKNHSRVCFTVVGETEILPEKFSTKYESVIVFGTAKKADDKLTGLRLLQEKYSPAFPEKGLEHAKKDFDYVEVYEITVEHMTAKGRR